MAVSSRRLRGLVPVEGPGVVVSPCELPVRVMGEVVVVAAESEGVVEVRGAALGPGVGVVDGGDGTVAVVGGTGVVLAVGDGEALRLVEQALFAAEVEGLRVAAEDHGDDAGGAGQAAELAGGEGGAGVEGSVAEAGAELVSGEGGDDGGGDAAGVGDGGGGDVFEQVDQGVAEADGVGDGFAGVFFLGGGFVEASVPGCAVTRPVAAGRVLGWIVRRIGWSGLWRLGPLMLGLRAFWLGSVVVGLVGGDVGVVAASG